MVAMVVSLSVARAAPIAASMAITRPRGDRAAAVSARSDSGGRRAGDFVASRGMPPAAGEESRRTAVAGKRSGRSPTLGQISPSEAVWSASLDRLRGDVVTLGAPWQEATAAERGKTCNCASTAGKSGPRQRQALISHHGALTAAPRDREEIVAACACRADIREPGATEIASGRSRRYWASLVASFGWTAPRGALPLKAGVMSAP